MDNNIAYQKAKLILMIYRDVVWSINEEIKEMQVFAYEMGGQNLEAGLFYLADFAPEIDAAEFEMRICEVMHSKMLIDIVDRAMIKLKNYPTYGNLYFEILTKQFIYRNRCTEKELLDILNIERSVFYDRKKEAINLFAVCLFGYTLPEFRNELMST